MTIGEFIVNFIEHYGDSTVARKGGWMPYQQRASIRLIRVVVKQLCQVLTWLWSRQCGKTECLSYTVAIITLLIFYQGMSPVPHRRLSQRQRNPHALPQRFPCRHICAKG